MFKGEVFPENTVAYELYPELPGESEEGSSDVLGVLLQTAKKCEEICGKEIAEYLWHYDSWELVPVLDGKGEDFVPHLAGSICFGDNVEDEWFVTWLLFKMTKFIPNLIARVFDSDGEILLIQAADCLPSWLDEHQAKNRVFIFQGEVHIISIPNCPSEVTPLASSQDPSLVDALRTVSAFPAATKTSEAVQKAVLDRLARFPDKMEDQLHRANVIVPAGVAAVLEAQPSLLAPAVHAFIERDPIDMRACRAMKYFPPEQCVKTRVTFTRCLYAMLCRSRCDPDPRTGWKLPEPSSPERKDAELGVKLAWGFEILAAASKPTETKDDPKSMEAEVEKDERWPKYIESLKNHGYFKGELEGSTEYDRLKAEAVDFFVTHILGIGGANARPGRRAAAGKEIHKLLSNLEMDVEELKRKAGFLPPSDDDSWLDVNQDDLDSMLRKHFGSSTNTEEQGEAIPDSLRLFLSKMSSFEGVDNASASGARKRSTGRKLSRPRKASAGPDRKISTMSAVSNLSEKITFDSEQFSANLRDILDLGGEESDSFDSDWSEEYGSEDDFDEAMAGMGMPMAMAMDTNANKLAKKPNRKISEEQREIMRIMTAMDAELMAPGKSVMGESFIRKETLDGGEYSVYSVDGDGGVGRSKPVDVDLNAMKNILESFEAQHGLPGPATTLLASLGQMKEA